MSQTGYGPDQLEGSQTVRVLTSLPPLKYKTTDGAFWRDTVELHGGILNASKGVITAGFTSMTRWTG